MIGKTAPPNDLFLPLLSKQGLAVVKLAGLFLTHRPGDRIQPIQQYAEEFGTGVGTVQAAIAYLQEIGAVELDSRGHLGTFVRSVNYTLIWSLTGQDYVVGGMPLPYSRRYEGLATGLHEAFSRAGVALNLVYTRGSLNRLRALEKARFDFVVLSRYAFNNSIEQGLAVEEALGLGTESYVGQHIILLRERGQREITDGMRVGIDPASIDQVLLTREACRGRNVTFVEMTYMNLMAAMERGQIDATVWNRDDFSTSAHPFEAVPLSLGDETPHVDENTEAVIAVPRGNQLVLQTVRSVVDKDFVRDIQKQVMENRMMPIY